MIQHGYDIANNIIGDVKVCGECFYDNRSQTSIFYAYTEKEIMEIATQKVTTLAKKHPACYPDNGLWKVKII